LHDLFQVALFATPDAADEWFKENDPEGVAFEYAHSLAYCAGRRPWLGYALATRFPDAEVIALAPYTGFGET
jgi:hypothetical protein